MREQLEDLAVTVETDDGEYLAVDLDQALATMKRQAIEVKIETLKITHGHQQTGTVLNDEYFMHNIKMLELELKNIN